MKMPLLLSCLMLVSMGENAIAHGVKLQTKLRPSVEITALFEDGTPLKQAQVQVYQPSQTDQAALTGKTNDQGQFEFTPDQEGSWDVFVRQAGHGSEVSIPISFRAQDGILKANTPTGQTLPQRIITIGAVIWGCLGTALYFKGRAK